MTIILQLSLVIHCLLFTISDNPSFEKEKFFKYLEKTDSRKLVLAKYDFFDLAKISPREN